VPPPTDRHLGVIDALRGFAVAQMIVYHLIYDLDYFGWIDIAMTRDQPWVGWRTAIVTQFLLLVGASLLLRHTFKPAWSDFWKRWAQVAAAAALVSLGSWFLLGPRLIWFGILHFIAVALILARFAVPLGRANIVLGIFVLALGLSFRHEFFNDVATSWVGFATAKPRTEDYVPIFPWFGVVLIGAGLAAVWQRHRFAIAARLRPMNDDPPRLLLLLGTWALTVYLVHQPVLIGLLWTVRKLGG